MSDKWMTQWLFLFYGEHGGSSARGHTGLGCILPHPTPCRVHSEIVDLDMYSAHVHSDSKRLVPCDSLCGGGLDPADQYQVLHACDHCHCVRGAMEHTGRKHAGLCTRCGATLAVLP